MTNKEIIEKKKLKLAEDIENLFEETDKINIYTLNVKVEELTKQHFNKASQMLRFFACGWARAMFFAYSTAKDQNQKANEQALKSLACAERDFDSHLEKYVLTDIEKREFEDLPF